MRPCSRWGRAALPGCVGGLGSAEEPDISGVGVRRRPSGGAGRIGAGGRTPAPDSLPAGSPWFLRRAGRTRNGARANCAGYSGKITAMDQYRRCVRAFHGSLLGLRGETAVYLEPHLLGQLALNEGVLRPVRLGSIQRGRG